MEKDQASDLHENQKPSQKQMQKPQENQKTPTLKPTTATNNKNDYDKRQRPIWDCGSTLYDSFELNSFRKQLDSAIISSSRSLSMPRLPSQGGPPPPPPPQKPPPSKLSRTFKKLLKSVFRSKNSSKPMNYDSGPDTSAWVPGQPVPSEKPKQIDGVNVNTKYVVVYEKVNALSTIPEVPEAAFSPEIGPLIRKTMSERFRSKSVSIYCA